MDSLKGHLLVAVPQLSDLNFHRAVVLVLQHDEEGASGLILNRTSGITVEDVWSQLSDEPCKAGDRPIYFGGPVEGPLMALHDRLACAEGEVITGVFLSMGRNYLDQLMSEPQDRIRIFSGYSGWGAGQLDAELSIGGWLTYPAESDHVFEPPDDLWKTICESIARGIVLRDTERVVIPKDPNLN